MSAPASAPDTIQNAPVQDAPVQNAPVQSAPVHNHGSTGPINDHDVEDWKNRFNEVLAKPGDVVNSKSPEHAQGWNVPFFGCLSPIDLCLVSWCLPCVTFGKTHHRIRKNANMEGYEPINTSCLLLCGSSCCGLYWIPLSMQRADIRAKYNLEGSCLTDIAVACCCGLCDLVQQEKESQSREPLNAEGVKQGYQTQGGMTYPATQ